MKKLISYNIFFILLFLLSACSTTETSKKNTWSNIAILMPLTGKNANTGSRAASMIELGLEEGLKGMVKVTTYDIADQEKLGITLTKIKARGTKLALGPIYSKEVEALSPFFSKYGITMITLSNNPALAGKDIFVFGHSPMKQTERIVNYMLDKGYKNYFALLPAGKYSNEVTDIMSDIIQSKGGKLVHYESYIDKSESISVAVNNIAKIIDSYNEYDENSQKAVLYISDEAPSLKKLVSELKKYNLDITTVIIGDNKINIEYDEPVSYLYTGSVEYQKLKLQKKLSEIGGQNNINFMDLMAYDLGRVVAVIIGENIEYNEFLHKLNSEQVYIGASGQIKFIDHIADRKYDIIKHNVNLKNDQIIDKAK